MFIKFSKMETLFQYNKVSQQPTSRLIISNIWGKVTIFLLNNKIFFTFSIQ